MGWFFPAGGLADRHTENIRNGCSWTRADCSGQKSALFEIFQWIQASAGVRASHFISLSRRRQGFESPWGRQVFIYFVNMLFIRCGRTIEGRHLGTGKGQALKRICRTRMRCARYPIEQTERRNERAKLAEARPGGWPGARTRESPAKVEAGSRLRGPRCWSIFVNVPATDTPRGCCPKALPPSPPRGKALRRGKFFRGFVQHVGEVSRNCSRAGSRTHPRRASNAASP
jgi:hypothetical protein